MNPDKERSVACNKKRFRFHAIILHAIFRTFELPEFREVRADSPKPGAKSTFLNRIYIRMSLISRLVFEVRNVI